MGLTAMSKKNNRPYVLLLGVLISLSITPSASFSREMSDQNSVQVPDFFAARFVVEVPEFPAGVATKRIEIHCDQPSSCLFQAGKSDAVRYKLVTQNQLLNFANGALTYARANPARFLTTNADWNERYLKPLLSNLVQVDQCMALYRKDYPGGNIFVCSLNAELWPQPAVILIGELKVSYPELFFGTTVFPAFKVSAKFSE